MRSEFKQNKILRKRFITTVLYNEVSPRRQSDEKHVICYPLIGAICHTIYWISTDLYQYKRDIKNNMD